MGHYEAECTRRKQQHDHVRAVRTEILGDIQEYPEDPGLEDGKSSQHQSEAPGHQASENGDNDVDQVEVDVYDNDYYTHELNYDLLAR